MLYEYILRALALEFAVFRCAIIRVLVHCVSLCCLCLCSTWLGAARRWRCAGARRSCTRCAGSACALRSGASTSRRRSSSATSSSCRRSRRAGLPPRRSPSCAKRHAPTPTPPPDCQSHSRFFVSPLSLSLSLTHTHTHTHLRVPYLLLLCGYCCECTNIIVLMYEYCACTEQ